MKSHKITSQEMEDIYKYPPHPPPPPPPPPAPMLKGVNEISKTKKPTLWLKFKKEKQ